MSICGKDVKTQCIAGRRECLGMVKIEMERDYMLYMGAYSLISGVCNIFNAVSNSAVMNTTSMRESYS